jgi:hypothetical protein
MRSKTGMDLLIADWIGDIGKLDDEVKKVGEFLPAQAKHARDSINECTEWLKLASDVYKKQVEDFANSEADRVENVIEDKVKSELVFIERQATQVVEALKYEVKQVVSSLPLNKSILLVVGLCFLCSTISAGVVGFVAYQSNSTLQAQLSTQNEQIIELLKGKSKK